MINIYIRKREIFISSTLTPVALSNRNKFRQQVIEAIDKEIINNHYTKNVNIRVNEFTLRRIIEKYSEQAVYRPIDDMRYYFQYSKRAFIEPGYPPLFYPAVVDRKRAANISAVSAIGEGVSGLVLQQMYGCRKLVRPYKDGVDIVMTNGRETYLIEAKGSATPQEEDFLNKLDNEYLLQMVCETLSSAGIDSRRLKGFLIGVHLKDELNYTCYITEIKIY
ncbi:hypothetical protein [Nostoc sp. FACHB-888]|uniref:hypothetical protein n=1 Tax=Nostoc sp. FACHB-888 TaxID=2692842 RepID=UPI0016860EB1|nr:hypothetical protein [Nostoc sp. FACHB-888]MBD2247249.1 hypothetical protein [Nostoc sp. FACHB-888]